MFRRVVLTLTCKNFRILAVHVALFAILIFNDNDLRALEEKPTPSYAEIMTAGPLGDVVLGDAAERVTLIEYGNFSCNHCVAFHQKVYPALKSRYIDTGKIRWIFREAVWDQPIDAAAFILARCAGAEKYSAFVQALYQRAANWLYAPSKPLPGLIAIAADFGMTQGVFNSCLENQKLVTDIQWEGARINKFTWDIPLYYIVDTETQVVSRVMREWNEQIDPTMWDKVLKPYFSK
jgi:protein-disulfide isomerase